MSAATSSQGECTAGAPLAVHGGSETDKSEQDIGLVDNLVEMVRRELPAVVGCNTVEGGRSNAFFGPNLRAEFGSLYKVWLEPGSLMLVLLIEREETVE